MDIEIKKKDGQRHTLNDFGFKVTNVTVESIEKETDYEKKENTSGRILLSSQYRKRTITVDCYVVSTKLNDNSRLRDEFYSLTNSNEPIHIRELRRTVPLNYRFVQPTEDDYQEIDEYNVLVFNHEPFNDNHYVNGRQYQVMCSDVVVPEENGRKINFSIKFETVELPFAESIGTSLELEKRPDRELWSNDMLIPFDEEDARRRYSFTNIYNNSVYYHGNVPNDQFNLFKKVTVVLGKNVKATEIFKFTLGNSDVMTIEGANLKKGDKIVYDGVQTFRNGIPINDLASNAQPKFYPGWNNFEFNQQVKSVTFDLKFYYL
ncbi:MAG: phage tail family protein [Staphylococcus sp.]|nr:phage tail family protein [Staphylococcus sp.]